MIEKKQKISIVTPFYNEETGNVVGIYFEKILPILENSGFDYEIICIDDGSKDKTYAILSKFAKKNKKIKLIKFSRNFGKEAALTAGIDASLGDCVIPLDADLQDPPGIIPDMLKLWKEGFEVVLPKRVTRNESFMKKTTASIFYHLINKVSPLNLQKNVGDFRLLDRKAVNEIVKLREKNRFMRGILSFSGFKTKVIKYKRPERSAGETKYSYIRLSKLALDGIFAFSILPIRLFLFFGLFVALMSVVWGIYIIYSKLVLGIAVSGYASIMTAVLFLNAVVLIGLGILGEYIGRIYEEVKNRPIYIVDEKINDK